MDYKIFEDAFSHNRRSQEHLVNLLTTRADTAPQFALFLGAGASVTSGVKPSKQMVSDWRRKLFASYKGADDYSTWLSKQDWFEAENEYAILFELVYDQPSQRRAYIEKAIIKANPSWGYAYYVSLMESKLFNVTFTTNFDDLLNNACYSFSNTLRPMVCSHDSAVSSVRVVSERPKIIKLHGDYLYDSIKNTSTELQSLEANTRDKFVEFAKQYGLIVLGYAGCDQSIMDMLDVLVRSENYFRNGIYWCIRKGTCPGRRLQQILRNDRVFWTEIDGFDEFVADLSRASGIGLPQGVISPHMSAFQRSKHLLDERPKTRHQVLLSAYSDTHEVYTRIKSALDDVGLSGWELGVKDDAFMELSECTIPFLRCLSLMEKEKYVEAYKALKPLTNDIKSTFSRSAWIRLIQCLLRQKGTATEVRAFLSSAPPPTWQDSSHYLQRSYYSLFLCDAKEALTFAERSLELNKGQVAAKVNKTLAYYMLRDKKAFEKALKDINTDDVCEQYRAAAYAMSGDLKGAIHHLQQAIVLGRYSASEACSDVVFRVLWSLPEFEAALKPFAQGTSLKYPYKETCPMSEPEKILHAFIAKSKTLNPSKQKQHNTNKLKHTAPRKNRK